MSGSAGCVLVEAALERLRGLGALSGVYDGRPLQAAFPYAEVEAGPETDWSHKTAKGRELRLAVTIRDKGERPERLRRLMSEVEEALAILGGALGEWQLAGMHFLRSRAVKDAQGAWAGLIEYRARMMKSR